MYMQLAVFCLLGVSMIMANGYGGSCSLQKCGQYAGVYQITITSSNLPSFYVLLTINPDGTADAIGSDINLGFSNSVGTWNCTGNTVVVTSYFFNFATNSTPALLDDAVLKLHFNDNQLCAGTFAVTVYDLISTQNPDTSQWVEVGLLEGSVKGYRRATPCKK